MAARVGHIGCLFGYEGNAFASIGDIEQALLRITAVHPMRKDAVEAFLAQASTDWTLVERLLDRGELVELAYQGAKFYRRNLG